MEKCKHFSIVQKKTEMEILVNTTAYKKRAEWNPPATVFSSSSNSRFLVSRYLSHFYVYLSVFLLLPSPHTFELLTEFSSHWHFFLYFRLIGACVIFNWFNWKYIFPAVSRLSLFLCQFLAAIYARQFINFQFAKVASELKNREKLNKRSSKWWELHDSNLTEREKKQHMSFSRIMHENWN